VYNASRNVGLVPPIFKNNLTITHYLLPDTRLMNETLKYLFKQEERIKSNLHENNIIYYRPRQNTRYYFKHLYAVDWHGVNEEETVFFPYSGHNTFANDESTTGQREHFKVFGEHMFWKKLVDNYPIAYYFANDKNLHVVRKYLKEILTLCVNNACKSVNASSTEEQIISVDSSEINNVQFQQTIDIGNAKQICYVSRNDSKKRVVLNEYKIIKMLNDDFKHVANVMTLVPSQYNLLQQAQWFKNCNIVVGPHGAGLTNILFTEPQSFLGLMIFPMISETKKTSYYKHLLAQLHGNKTLILLNSLKSTRTGNYTGLMFKKSTETILSEIKNKIIELLQP
jgi:hypothetical protein